MNGEVYYQPIMTDAQWNEHRDFNSFDVYRSFHKAKADFPDCEIGAYSGDDIEDPNYVDDIQQPLTVEQIAKNLLSDKEAYNEFVEAMLVSHLKHDVKTQVYWDAWFRGAKGKDLEDADNGKVFTK